MPTSRSQINVVMPRILRDDLSQHRAHDRQPLHAVIRAVLEEWKQNNRVAGRTVVRAGTRGVEFTFEDRRGMIGATDPEAWEWVGEHD